MSNPAYNRRSRSTSVSEAITPQAKIRSRPESKRRRTTIESPTRSSATAGRSSSTESRTSQATKKKGMKRIFASGGGFSPTKWLVFSKSDSPEYQWDFSYHYFLGLLGCTISLNDLVKFPERCINYGGAWFLAIHLFFTLVFAFPFFIVENLLGQCSGATAMQAVNNICPILGGFGLAIMVTRMIELVELSSWLCWSWLYLFATFTPELPWSECGHHWNNITCSTKKQQENCAKVSKVFWNLTCSFPSEFCQYHHYHGAVNHTHCKTNSSIVSISDIESRVGPGYQFMLYITRNPILFENITDAYLLLAYTMCWVFYYICIWNGMKSTVHITHITLSYTFLALLILMATTFLMEGSSAGISKHMFQDISALGKPRAWLEALRSSLDTFSLGFAINFMYAKFNDYSYNFMRPLAWIVVIDITFCVMFSFTVAAFIGMAEFKHENVEFAMEGISLLLDSVPRIFRYFPSPNIFCGIFYLFCISISMELGFVLLETILISIISIAPKIKPWKQYARMVLCFSQWCVGLFFFTRPGMEVLESAKRCNDMDSDFLFAIEAILITWLYGFAGSVKWKHFHDFKDMLGYVPRYHYYLKVGFYITAPVCSLVYTISRFSTFELPVVEGWWIWIVYVLFLGRSPCILIIYGILKIKHNIKKNKPVWHLLLPEQDWVPED